MRMLLLVCAASFAACSAPESRPATAPQTAATAPPALDQLGGHHFAITTAVPAAQVAFDQGLAWCYGFHHAEALRCFGEAAAADPKCAMAFWGLAYAAGPHINNMEMSPEAAQAANENAQRAASLAAAATPLEQALVRAIGRRYAWPAPAERKQLDTAYANAMREAYAAHRAHPDVGALFAESLMDLWPWDLWKTDGTPQPDTLEIVTVLEGVLAAHPRHPQANHLYIHAVEASPQPERAVAAGERLGALAPAIGHLVHMPAHVFLRVGRYEDSCDANRRGIASDLRIVDSTGRTGFYEVYRAHNYHFLAFSAMFTGDGDEAVAAAQSMLKELPVDVVKQLPQFLEGFFAVPYHVDVRFGRFREVLAMPEPEPWQKGTIAVRHYARGIAHAALGDVEAAKREQQAFAQAVAAVPEDWTLGRNPQRTVLAVGAAFLDGEVAFRAGDQEAAFTSLRRAVELADALQYDEPWGWMMPPRHALGALLLEAGRVADAQAVYEQDLRQHPENGWALKGLAECRRRSGDLAAAAAVDARFAKAWSRKAPAIGASCFCRRG